VEDRSDWEFLQRTGCRHAQGYFIARPMRAAELPGWMQAWAKRVQDEFLIGK
jgi:EAL domain-containing protein (putative c-di-GMP-specific phosphodiesterase class I)